jgi:hypothetical protein
MTERTDKERIAELEATVRVLVGLLNPTMDSISTAYRTALALQIVLAEKRILSDEEVAGKMQALDDEATLEVEHAPEYEEFRRAREAIRRAAAEAAEPEDQPKDQT